RATDGRRSRPHRAAEAGRREPDGLMRGLLAALRLALRAISRSKLRASLTVLGILIGVAAVVVVVALGTGVRGRVLGQISSLGASIVYVFPQSTQSSGARRKDTGRLTEADGAALMRDATSISLVAPFSSAGGQVVSGDRN